MNGCAYLKLWTEHSSTIEGKRNLEFVMSSLPSGCDGPEPSGVVSDHASSVCGICLQLFPHIIEARLCTIKQYPLIFHFQLPPPRRN